eukprot:5052740-Pyramimonas_sp.AAC.1
MAAEAATRNGVVNHARSTTVYATDYAGGNAGVLDRHRDEQPTPARPGTPTRTSTTTSSSP